MAKTVKKPGARVGSLGALGLAVLLVALAPAESPVADAAMRGQTEVVRSLLSAGPTSMPPTATA